LVGQHAHVHFGIEHGGTMITRFRDRREAGKVLAQRLEALSGLHDAIVIALPRGGVVVGYEVARGLNVPLDVLIVRKLGVPGHEELGFGAIASGGIQLLNRDLVRALQIDGPLVEHVVATERRELARREVAYRGDRPPMDVRGRVVILVDDGLATGATMLAAVEALHQAGASSVIAAVPVASREACGAVAKQVDRYICLVTPTHFPGVGAWYDNFDQTTDAEVKALLAASAGQTSIPEQSRSESRGARR
jgi:putative phosphoribosyl transferase